MQRDEKREPDAEDDQGHEEMVVGEDGSCFWRNIHAVAPILLRALKRTKIMIGERLGVCKPVPQAG
jgi:hypothetical protein